LVPRSSSTLVAAWAWPTWIVSRSCVLEAVFILWEPLSPSRRIFISSIHSPLSSSPYWSFTLLLPARFFSTALTLALLLRDRMLRGVAPSKHSHPLLCLHYCSFHLMILLWVTSMLPCLTCLHDIPAKQSLGYPHACPLHVV
jgi:hypothetical protein